MSCGEDVQYFLREQDYQKRVKMCRQAATHLQIAVMLCPRCTIRFIPSSHKTKKEKYSRVNELLTLTYRKMRR